MRLFLLCLITLFWGGCHILKPATEVASLNDIQWVLTAINHKPVSSHGTAYLEFNEKMDVKGKAFCNTIKTDYSLMGKDQLTFGKISSTKMYCDGVMNLEHEMVTNMQNVKRYEIRNQMLYLYNSDEVLLTFKMK